MVVSKWPKSLPAWSAEQVAIADDFMHHWHATLARRYPFVERLNHGYPVRHGPKRFTSTLEIGAGRGDHIARESLTAEQEAAYVAIDLRGSMIAAIRRRFPRMRAFVADIEKGLDFSAGAFDRILAIHVLEHLPDLPRALREIHRLMAKPSGVFLAVIPCEGGLGYALARRFSSRRVFERRYGTPYRWFIEREHVNSANEILAEIDALFAVRHRTFFPLRLPLVGLNLCIGMTLAAKPPGVHAGENAAL